MDIEISKKTIGIAGGIFALVIAPFDPMLALFFAVMIIAFLLFWHRHEERGNLSHFTPIRSSRKQEHLESVMGLASSRESITNNDVEEALGVSDATAERYLNELEAEGRIVQHGATGRSVTYTVAK